MNDADMVLTFLEKVSDALIEHQYDGCDLNVLLQLEYIAEEVAASYQFVDVTGLIEEGYELLMHL